MTYPDERNERIDRWLIASTVLHIALFTLLILSPHLFPRTGTSWGSPNGGTGGISAKIVTSISGVPLKTPEVVNDTAPANDSPGFYKSEPAPAAVPDETAEPVPEPTAPVKPPPKPKPPAAKSTPAPETKPTEAPETKSTAAPAPKSTPAPDTPTNAIPYGQGGRPSLAYGPQFSTGAGEGGIAFGDTSFGDRYGTYVNSITRAISNNWLKSLVDASVQKAPRVYLSFTIGRDGTVSDVEVKQSSGNPSLDRSAKRAVLASSPLPALPADYRGGSINVSFYFEYSR